MDTMRARLQELMTRVESQHVQARAAHVARMATLPPGTCDVCYGTRRDAHAGHHQPCRVCDPPPARIFAAGVPLEFHLSRLDNWEITSDTAPVHAKASAFLAGTRDLFITGGVGSGKTRLACAVANEAMVARLSARFCRVPMVLHQLQPGRSPEEVAALERQLFSARVLVLDDLGAERDVATDYTRRTLLMIYEERSDRGHRTIFTSNKTLGQLAEMQDDDRLVSRIAGRADVVTLATPDQRLVRRRG